MIKKLTLVTLAAIFLGGCSLQNYLKPDSAATDQKEVVMESPSPSPSSSPDPELDKMSPTSSSTEEFSLESDIGSTVILEEDFSDLN